MYLLLFTLLAGVVALLRWTFSSNQPTVVTAHVLDARHGHRSFRWRLGPKVPRSALADLVEHGQVFVIVAYDGAVAKNMIVSSQVWREAKRELDEIDAAAEIALRRAIRGIDELQGPKMMDGGGACG